MSCLPPRLIENGPPVETPGTLLIPVLEWVVSSLMLFYFLVSVALIVTTDWAPAANLQQALQETNPDESSFCPPSICSPTMANVTAALVKHDDMITDTQYLMVQLDTAIIIIAHSVKPRTST